MPQMQFPIFPSGVTHITKELAFKKDDETKKVVYFNGSMPIFIHDVSDVRSFKMITSQFCVSGCCKQSEVARAFGVAEISVKRAVKLYRSDGPAGFFKKKKSRKKTVLTKEVLVTAQDLLNQNILPKEIAATLNIKPDTLRKAISSGRLQKIEKKVLSIT